MLNSVAADHLKIMCGALIGSQKSGRLQHGIKIMSDCVRCTDHNHPDQGDTRLHAFVATMLQLLLLNSRGACIANGSVSRGSCKRRLQYWPGHSMHDCVCMNASVFRTPVCNYLLNIHRLHATEASATQTSSLTFFLAGQLTLAGYACLDRMVPRASRIRHLACLWSRRRRGRERLHGIRKFRPLDYPCTCHPVCGLPPFVRNRC